MSSAMLGGRSSVGLRLAAICIVTFCCSSVLAVLDTTMDMASIRPQSKTDVNTIVASSFTFAFKALKILSRQEKESIKALVVEQCKQLSKLGVTYWLDRGTLLGAARDGGIIDYDTDGDLAMLDKDADKVWDALKTWKQGRDLPEGMTASQVGYGPIPYLSQGFHGMHSDVSQVIKGPDGMLTDPYGGAHTSTFESEFGKMQRKIYSLAYDDVLPTQPCEFEGFQGCQCPKNIPAYLAGQYGENWYVPLPWEASTRPEEVAKMLKKTIAYDSSALTDEMKDHLRAMLSKLETKGPAPQARTVGGASRGGAAGVANGRASPSQH